MPQIDTLEQAVLRAQLSGLQGVCELEPLKMQGGWGRSPLMGRGFGQGPRGVRGTSLPRIRILFPSYQESFELEHQIYACVSGWSARPCAGHGEIGAPGSRRTELIEADWYMS